MIFQTRDEKLYTNKICVCAKKIVILHFQIKTINECRILTTR